MDEQVTLYALCEPDSGAIRYVGQTRGRPEARLRAHLSDCRDGDDSARGQWLRGLLAQGLSPILRVLETVEDARADEAEQEHVARYRAQGCILTNDGLARPYGRVGRRTSPETTAVRLPAEAKRRLDAWAKRADVTSSRIMRGLLIEALNAGRDERGEVP